MSSLTQSEILHQDLQVLDPFLDLKSKDEAKKDLTIPQIEENLMKEQLAIDQETYRKD